MTIGSMIELAVAALVLGGGIWLYRARKTADEGYGSQGAVILFVIAVILAIHGSGALKYRPSASELEMYQGLKDMGRQ
jgi:hypothetical protein